MNAKLIKNLSASERAALIRSIETEAWFDMLDAAPATIRQKLGISTFQTENASFLACRELDAVPFNRGFAIKPNWTTDRAEMSEGIEWLDRHASSGWALQIDPDGFGKSETVLGSMQIRQIDSGWVKFSADLTTRSGAEDVRAQLVQNEQQVKDFANVVTAGFSFPAVTLDWFEALTRREGWSCYVAYLGEKPSAAAASFRSSSGAWFGVDATLDYARRQGLQGALIAMRLDQARQSGSTVAMAETGRPTSHMIPEATSYRNYLRAGFQIEYYSANFQRERPPVTITRTAAT